MKRKRSSKPQKPKTPQNNAALHKSESDGRTPRNITSMLQKETETQRTGSFTRGRDTDLEIERKDNGRMEISTNGLSHMIASIIKEISKESGGLGNLSRSLVDERIINGQMAQSNVDMGREENRSQMRQNSEYKQQMAQSHVDMGFNENRSQMQQNAEYKQQMAQSHVDMGLEENRSQMHQNPEYKQEELNAALEVIQKTMNLDAAEPFNKPVDPVALGIPDYFDVIKTPMDFGTICNNLENGLKYMNSADVFKDVQYIWHNCLTYNKKGDHILKLMKRVEAFFMKHWKAARLNTEQSAAVIDVLPLTESSILRHSKRQKENPLAINFTPLQENEAGQSQKSSSQQQSSSEKDEPYVDSSNTQKKHQIQGLTHGTKLLMSAGRIKVVTNEQGQPVGPGAQKLTRCLGHIARDGNMAPLTYNGWSKMPEEKKENMWQKVLTRFDIEPCYRDWVLLSLGSKWRNFKGQLKTAHYDTHATDEERLADRDGRVLPDQWSFLVSQWSSDEFQKLSARNKANRAKLKFMHTSGTKSFARLLEEEKEKRPDGKELSQAELFILTRTRKNGQPVNEPSAAVISKLRESATPDDTYHQVMGVDRKCVVSTSELNATTGTVIPSHAEALKMVEEKSIEVVEMKERLASVEETCSQMAAQMSAMMSMMANMQKAYVGENISNGVPHTSVPVGRPSHTEPAFTSNHEVPAQQTRGRKKRR